MKLLQNRFKNFLHKLINPDQTGFMKGRFIGENIRKTLDIMEFTENENIPALMMAIVFEKCFDRI